MLEEEESLRVVKNPFQSFPLSLLNGCVGFLDAVEPNSVSEEPLKPSLLFNQLFHCLYVPAKDHI